MGTTEYTVTLEGEELIGILTKYGPEGLLSQSSATDFRLMQTLNEETVGGVIKRYLIAEKRIGNCKEFEVKARLFGVDQDDYGCELQIHLIN